MGVQLQPAPVCQIAQDGSQIVMGDLTRPYNGPVGSAALNKESSTGSLANKTGNAQTN